MKITIKLRNAEKTLKKETTVQRAMELLEILPEEYLAVRDGQLLTEDDRLKDGDEVQFISVISGG